MEEHAAKGLKTERDRRKRIAAIRKMILFTVTAWIFLSMAVCIGLLFKVYSLEAKLDYLLDNFTVSGQIEAESNHTLSEADQSSYFDLEDATEPAEPAEQKDDYAAVAPAAGQQENLAEPDDVHKVYLTFDDGPSSKTIQILEILKKYNVKASFFVIGKEDEASKALYKRIVEEGHTLGMHSYTHQYKALYKSLDSFREDFSRIQNYLFEVTGQECLFYRFPGGSSNRVGSKNMDKFIAYLEKQNTTYVDWNVSSGDAMSQAYTPAELKDHVLSDVVKYKTSIVLMHDAETKTATVEALEPMIQALQGMGAQLLPIDENTAVVHHAK